MPQLIWSADGVELDVSSEPYLALLANPWGDWQAVTTATESLYVDGSVISGETSGNRSIGLQIHVSAATRTSLISACEALARVANAASGTLSYIPDGGGSWVVYDVFRAQPERSDEYPDQLLRRTYTFTIPAKPFPRSPSSVTVAAAAPGLVLASFDAATTGVDLWAPTRVSNNQGGPWNKVDATGSTGPVSTVFSGNPASLVDLTNGTYVPTGGGVAQVTATTAGLVEAAQDVSFASSGAVVAISLGATYRSPATPVHVQAGIEWRDASNAVVQVDWSPVEVTPAPDANQNGYGPYFAAPRPSTATKARIRMRVTDAQAGATYAFTQLTMADVAAYTLPTTGTMGVPNTSVSLAHDGSGGLHILFGPRAFAWTAFAAPVSLTGMAGVSGWVLSSASGTKGTLTLFDTSGRWSRWVMPYNASAVVSWQNASVDLSDDPDATASTGAADLSAIASFAFGVTGSSTTASGDMAFDTLMAGPKDSLLTTQHGSVVQLNITGSARSTVAMTVSNVTPMTDCLLAAADVSVSPMLPVASSVATAVAPAAYDGVYRVIGALVPASTEVSPTCVVNQLVGGVSVATQTLTGTLLTGNHYCDFGAVALPLVGYPDDNQAVSYTFTLAPADTDWAEVLVLDVDQPMVWLSNMSTSRSRMWVDEPDALAQLGRVWVGSAADRSDARSPSTPPDLSRPFQVQCPSVRLLAYSTSGAPAVSLTYFPHWLVEPLE